MFSVMRPNLPLREPRPARSGVRCREVCAGCDALMGWGGASRERSAPPLVGGRVQRGTLLQRRQAVNAAVGDVPAEGGALSCGGLRRLVLLLLVRPSYGGLLAARRWLAPRAALALSSAFSCARRRSTPRSLWRSGVGRRACSGRRVVRSRSCVCRDRDLRRGADSPLSQGGCRSLRRLERVVVVLVRDRSR